MTEKLEALFAEIIEVPLEQINDETSPKNTSGWDSLTAMHLVAAIETTYNVHFTTKEIEEMNSVGRSEINVKK